MSCLLFGLVVPLAFRESLKGSKIPISNLYWIVLSEIGALALGYFAFKETLNTKQYVAVALLVVAFILAAMD